MTFVAPFPYGSVLDLKTAVSENMMYDIFHRYSKEVGPIVKLDVPIVSMQFIV